MTVGCFADGSVVRAFTSSPVAPDPGRCRSAAARPSNRSSRAPRAETPPRAAARRSFMLQPSESRRQAGFSRSCQVRRRASGARPCSTKSSRPCGFSTRFTSASARLGSAMLQSTQVITTVSIEESSKGSSSGGRRKRGFRCPIDWPCGAAPSMRGCSSFLPRFLSSTPQDAIKKAGNPRHESLPVVARGFARVDCRASLPPLEHF